MRINNMEVSFTDNLCSNDEHNNIIVLETRIWVYRGYKSEGVKTCSHATIEIPQKRGFIAER